MSQTDLVRQSPNIPGNSPINKCVEENRHFKNESMGLFLSFTLLGKEWLLLFIIEYIFCIKATNPQSQKSEKAILTQKA